MRKSIILNNILIIMLVCFIINCSEDIDDDDDDNGDENNTATIIKNIDISLVPDFAPIGDLPYGVKFDLIIKSNGKFGGLHMYSTSHPTPGVPVFLRIPMLKYLVNEWSIYQNDLRIDLSGRIITNGTGFTISYCNVNNTSGMNKYAQGEDFQHNIYGYLDNSYDLQYITLTLRNDNKAITNEMIIYNCIGTYYRILDGTMKTSSWSLADEFQKKIDEGVFK
jgi:hypothetical protein